MVLTLRWCVMEGSADAAGAAPGDLLNTNQTIRQATLGAGETWNAADLAFVALVVDRDGHKGVPVIADTDDFRGPGESTGDIVAAGGDTFEAAIAAEECDRSWRALDPAAQRPVVVVARRFVDAGLTEAASSTPPLAVRVGGSRSDDLCAAPRSLVGTDVLDIGPHTSVDRGWVVTQEFARFADRERRVRALAHELGHVLLLGHGNGLDDDGDGQVAGTDGPRRYDQYCDNLRLGEDDLADPPSTCAASLMMPSPCGDGLTPLQVEQARAAAAVLSGCTGSGCGSDW